MSASPEFEFGDLVQRKDDPTEVYLFLVREGPGLAVGQALVWVPEKRDFGRRISIYLPSFELSPEPEDA